MSNLKEKYMNSYQKQIENLYLGILNNYSNFLNLVLSGFPHENFM